VIPATVDRSSRGKNRLVLGIVLAVVTFWLFAQTTLNVAPTIRDDLQIRDSLSNVAVSIAALFRFAGAVALLFNVLMVAVAMVAIARTVPRDGPDVGR